MARTFEDLVAEAWHVEREGWDFSWLAGRVEGVEPPWDYRGRARELVRAAGSLLDVDTGGGEFLADLAPLPPRTVATESWEPNLAVAQERLGRLGVRVEERPEGRFDLVLNRHGRLDAPALAELLDPGGTLLTQQVGSRNQLELNEALGVQAPQAPHGWTLSVAVDQVEAAGLRVLRADEASLPFTYRDIGAVVHQLRLVAWQVPGFQPVAYDERLRALDRTIRRDGGFTVHDHRFWLEAELPH